MLIAISNALHIYFVYQVNMHILQLTGLYLLHMNFIILRKTLPWTY